MEVGAAGAHLPDQEEEGEGDNQVEERLVQVSQLIFRASSVIVSQVPQPTCSSKSK